MTDDRNEDVNESNCWTLAQIVHVDATRNEIQNWNSSSSSSSSSNPHCPPSRNCALLTWMTDDRNEEDKRRDEDEINFSFQIESDVHQDINYYEALGVNVDATDTEIRKAYRTIQEECHPDRCVHLPRDAQVEKTERFIAANNAFAVLTDPDLRRRYNTVRGYPLLDI